MRYLLPLILAFPAFGGPLDIDPEFLPYVVAMKAHYREINHEQVVIGKLAIHRGELFNRVLGTDPDAVGECHQDPKDPRITIGFWGAYGECQKEELITHEIGHCLFQMDHKWGGFMDPKMHTEKECKANLSSFRQHFYTNAKKMRDWQKKKEQIKREITSVVIYYEEEN